MLLVNALLLWNIYPHKQYDFLILNYIIIIFILYTSVGNVLDSFSYIIKNTIIIFGICLPIVNP